MEKKSVKISIFKTALIMLLLSMYIAFGAVSIKSFKANAVSNPSDVKVLYYFDTQALISDTEVDEIAGGGADVLYQQIDDAAQLSMVEDNVEQGKVQADVAIFQFMEMTPDNDILQSLFEKLKSRECKILFLSGEPLSSYDGLAFMSCVDEYLNVATSDFRFYVTASVLDMRKKYANGNSSIGTATEFSGILDNSCILIDSRFVDLTLWEGYDLFDSSAHLRALLEQLNEQLNYQIDFETAADPYSDILANAENDKIKLALNYSGNEYINLYQLADAMGKGSFDAFDNLSFTAGKFDSFVSELFGGNSETVLSYVNVYAMGRSYLETDFYKFLDVGQDYLKIYSKKLPVYIWEVEPLIYAPDGLEVITDTDLRNMYDVAGGIIYDYIIETDPALKRKFKSIINV